MKVGLAENLVRNNFIWSNIQRSFILPFWDDLIEPPEGFIGLQIGCGRGRGTAAIFDRFNPWRLDAQDSEPLAVELAGQYLGKDYEDKIFLREGKFSSIDAADEKYDVVFDFFNLHHSRNWRKGILEISRVLKPGGYFAFGEIYESRLTDYVTRNLLRKNSRKRFERDQLLKEMAEHRLRLLEKNHRLWGYGIIGVARKVE